MGNAACLHTQAQLPRAASAAGWPASLSGSNTAAKIGPGKPAGATAGAAAASKQADRHHFLVLCRGLGSSGSICGLGEGTQSIHPSETTQGAGLLTIACVMLLIDKPQHEW